VFDLQLKPSFLLERGYWVSACSLPEILSDKAVWMADVENKFELFASGLDNDDEGLVVALKARNRNDPNLASLAEGPKR
jgi:hypothetical protein